MVYGDVKILSYENHFSKLQRKISPNIFDWLATLPIV